MKLKDRTAIVTGAAQGIGFAIANRFAREGAKVILVDISEQGDQKAEEIRKAGFAAEFMRADVSRKADVNAVIQNAVWRHGRIDILVNNAGVSVVTPFLDVTEEEFDRVISVNLKSVFLFGQGVAREMIGAGVKGTIINMSSVAALLANPTQASYGASKGGINSLTKAMAIALAEHGIRVNAIGPGTILTELARRVAMSDEAARQRTLSRIPLGRGGEPEEVAAIAVFLASEDASYITGQTLYPDGGRLALNYTVPVKP